MTISRALFDWKLDWWLVASAAVLLVLLLVVLILYISSEHGAKRFQNALDNQSSSVRVFTLYLKEEKVRYFNATDVTEVHECTLGEFYQKFPIAAQKRVINWINALADANTKAPHHLEVDVREAHTNRQFFSLLQVESVNLESRVINLTSYLFKSLAINRGDSPESTHGLATPEEFTEALHSSKRHRGVTLGIRLAHKRATEHDAPFEPLVIDNVKNALAPCCARRRMLTQLSDCEFAAMDLQIEDSARALSFAHECCDAINRYLSLNALFSSYDVRVSAVEHRHFLSDPDKILETAQQLASDGFAGKDQVLLYEQGKRIFTEDIGAYRTEVERIISEKKIRYKFRPVFSVVRGRVVGYLSKAEPTDTFFETLNEMKDYAIRTEDDRALFSTLAKDTLRQFLAERPNDTLRLFYDVRLSERGYMLVSLARISNAKNAHLVLVFDETDLAHSHALTSEDMLIADMRSIKAKGYEIAININTNQLSLDTKIYAVFDYFICSFAGENGGGDNSNTKLRSHLHTIVEKLLKYHKPIIASDFEGWPAIELMVRSGLEYISSEAFAPYDTMMNPVNPKTIKRVKDMRG